MYFGKSDAPELDLYATGKQYAMDSLEGDNVVTRLHVGDTFTNGLDETGTLVSEDDRESTLGVLAGQCVGI